MTAAVRPGLADPKPGRPGRGYVPIGDYAAIGDGRTVALVARDGSIDWLCLPDLDSPSVFGGMLDAAHGGRFELQPEIPSRVTRCYRPDTNVLETTFTTEQGVVRVTDAMALPNSDLGPAREVIRRIEALSGEVPMRWSVEPSFGYGARAPRLDRRAGIPLAFDGRDAVAVCSWGAGEAQIRDGAVSGRFEARQSSPAMIALCAAHQEPLVLPTRRGVDARLEGTITYWQEWAGRRAYDGPWRDAVVRGALALKLLIHASSGAIAAAATTSLPEEIGGERNWDYRYSWVRDSAFTLRALLQLGCPSEADAFFWWLLHASQLTTPRLQVLYRLDGGEPEPERVLDLDGYRGSTPVRVGNDAARQTQLDIYGSLLQTVVIYVEAGGRLDRDTGRRFAGIADLVCRSWREPDSGIWEVRSAPAHFTHSKMMCWVALDRALRLCEAGAIPSEHASTWNRGRVAVGDFIETRCWSPELGSYTRQADGDDLDASLLLGVLFEYVSPDPARLAKTVDVVRRDLGQGPLLSRYDGDDGLDGTEGAFLCCSFWLADALARVGRVDEATELMDELVALSNDVGLYSEEFDFVTGEQLGNTPQALVHLALVNAAVSIARAAER